MSKEIRVPTLGESVTEATVGQWFKSVGDTITIDEPVVELETDKVTIEVPAPGTGILKDIGVNEGETVEVGALLGSVDENEANAQNKEASIMNGAATPEENDSAQAATDEINIVVPALGESVTEATIGQFFKAVGDTVATDEPIVELETDKVSIEVPAPSSGTLTSLAVAEGDTIEVGALLATMAAGEAGTQPAAAEESPAPAEPQANGQANDMDPSPAAAKLMAEKNIDASQVEGSGKRGQILKEDVMKAEAQPAAASGATAAPAASGAANVPDSTLEERVRMSKLRQTIATRLKDAQNTAAMLTTFNDVDMSAVMELRSSYKDLFEKKHGVKLGFMSFFVKAAIQALKEIPAVNAEIDGTDIIYKNYYHVGVAVGTDKGLVVPVIRDADQLSLAGIEKTITDFGMRARDGKLGINEMQGGTFTISNGGVYGSMLSTPILNAPQSGILGMHRIEQKPVVKNGEIVIRPIMYLALSYDHRIVDGKEAVTFLVRIKENLEDPQRLVLDL